MFVYTTMANFFNDSESFSIGIVEDFNIGDHREDWKSATGWQAVGTLLTAILNADFRHLDESSPLHSLYTEYEVANGYFSKEADHAKATISRIKKFIDFFEEKKIAYDRNVFFYLWNNGYFLEDTSILVDADTDLDVSSLWDSENDCLVDDIEKIYQTLTTGAKRDGSTVYLFAGEYRLWASALVSLMAIVDSGKQIKKCQNCGKYYLPGNRSDTMYCNNTSPQDSTMTCKEYGTRRLWYERLKEDELATLSRKIASAKGMLAKRHPDLPQYAKSYEYFKSQRLIWIKAVKEGTKTQEEYKEWLLYMQSQQRIKEATNGND